MISELSLGDRQAVEAALYRYIRGMDTNDSAALLKAFAPEGVIIKADGTHYSGTDGLTNFLREAMTAPDATRRQHYLQPLLFRGAGAQVAVLSAYQVAVIGVDGQARLVTQGYYDDRVTRDGTGHWRLVSKTIIHQREGKVSGGKSMHGLKPLSTTGLGRAAPTLPDPLDVAAVCSAIASFGIALTCGDAHWAASSFHANGSLSMVAGHVVTGSAGVLAFLSAMLPAEAAERSQHRLSPVFIEKQDTTIRVASYWRVESTADALTPRLRTIASCDDVFIRFQGEWWLDSRQVSVLEYGSPIFSTEYDDRYVSGASR